MTTISHYYNKLGENTRLNLEHIVLPLTAGPALLLAGIFAVSVISNSLSTEPNVEPQSSSQQETMSLNP